MKYQVSFHVKTWYLHMKGKICYSKELKWSVGFSEIDFLGESVDWEETSVCCLRWRVSVYRLILSELNLEII